VILAHHTWVALAIQKLLALLPMTSAFSFGTSFVASFFSHFALDRIPHADWAFVEGEVDRRKLFLIAFVDVGLAVAVWLITSWAFFEITFGGFFCSFAACAPDLNKFIKFPAIINNLHELAHHSWRKNGNNDGLPAWQLGFVAMIILAAILSKALGS